MKKFIISILILMFFAVSCNSSKQTENDTDLLPDEDEINDEETEADVDENDEEAVEPDEESDEEQNNSDEDEIMNIDPCDPNPCVGIENSTEKCRASGMAKYSCGCVEGYFWEGKKCVESPCNAEPCKNHEHSNNRCEPRDKQTYICACIEGYSWDGLNNACIKG